MVVDVKLTKHVFGDLKLDPIDLVGIYGPRAFDGPGLSDEEIAERIKTPTGTQQLRELAKTKQNVLIVTDDNTRSTPLSRLLPPIIIELQQAGVTPDNITILIGLGTHRPMTEKEIRTKFGKEIAQNYNIVNHAWSDPKSLVSLGVCDLGFEVVINKLVQETDLIISIGSIVPHATTGFSGGGKTIMPGICGERTIEDTHWSALKYDMSQILGNLNNRVRNAIISICRKVNLDFIVNSVLFNEGNVYDVVTGDVEEAHYKGVELCRSIYGASIPEKSDIVIAEAYPTDIDLRQAIKAICSADLVCKDGGVIILPAECPEGLAPQFPNFAKYGFSNPDQLYLEVENQKVKEKLLAYTLVAIGRIISKRVSAVLVSSNIDRKTAKKMGFHWASNLQEAWNLANQITNNAARTIVLRKAGELLPETPK